jgi:hypothetical protein
VRRNTKIGRSVRVTQSDISLEVFLIALFCSTPIACSVRVYVSGFGDLAFSVLASGTFGDLAVSVLASGTFGDLAVSMLASGTQDGGFAPGRSRRIFRAKKS